MHFLWRRRRAVFDGCDTGSGFEENVPATPGAGPGIRLRVKYESPVDSGTGSSSQAEMWSWEPEPDPPQTAYCCRNQRHRGILLGTDVGADKNRTAPAPREV